MPNLSRKTTLILVFSIQALCAAFFLSDAVMDMLGIASSAHSLAESDAFEYVVAVALTVGVVFTGLELRRMVTRQKRMEDQLRAASGAFAELLDEHFDAWNLTPSERDVALLAIKGLSIADMARVRETREGTIKAQCNAVYRKAGVTGRMQLLSLFVEELMAPASPYDGTVSSRPGAFI